LTNPKPLRCTTRPFGGISTSLISRFPTLSGFTKRFLFSLVKKNQPKEAMSFRFFKAEYQGRVIQDQKPLLQVHEGFLESSLVKASWAGAFFPLG